MLDIDATGDPVNIDPSRDRKLEECEYIVVGCVVVLLPFVDLG